LPSPLPGRVLPYESGREGEQAPDLGSRQEDGEGAVSRPDEESPPEQTEQEDRPEGWRQRCRIMLARLAQGSESCLQVIVPGIIQSRIKALLPEADCALEIDRIVERYVRGRLAAEPYGRLVVAGGIEPWFWEQDRSAGLAGEAVEAVGAGPGQEQPGWVREINSLLDDGVALSVEEAYQMVPAESRDRLREYFRILPDGLLYRGAGD